MNRAVSGTLEVLGTGRPLKGVQVVAARVTPEGAEPLGACVSSDLGRFRVMYDPLPDPADLTLFLFCPAGDLIYTEPIHRHITGAELQLRVQVPGETLLYTWE